MIDAKELLRAYATEGSEVAFGEIVRRHVDFVYSTALRKVGGDRHLAEDVTQTVFTDLARKAKSLPKDVVLAGWLHRDTCFRAADAVRREQRRRVREQKAVEMQMLDRAGEDLWMRVAPFVDDAMEKLSNPERDALLLRFIEGKSWRETGQALAVSEEAVQKRASRALEKLRAILARRGVVISSAAMATVLTGNAVQAAPAGLVTSLAGTALAGAGSASLLDSLTEMLFMTTKTKIAIVAVAGIAVVSTPLVWQQRVNGRLRQELASAEKILSATRKLAADGVGQAVTNVAPNWQTLESRDYRQYIANLRAAGCPEQTIRDIIITDLDRTYGQRIAKFSGPSHATFWKAPNYMDGVKQYLEVKKIEEEKRAAIRELLGVDADEESERRTGQQVGYSEGFEFLSAEQRARLREIERQAHLKIESANLIPEGTFSPAYNNRKAEAQAWKDEEIKKVMSPEQFEEYELRVGGHAYRLRNGLRVFDPTEEEFRTIYELERRFGIDQANAGGKAGTAERRKIDEQTGLPIPPATSVQQFEEALKEALGEQRYADYQLMKESNYVMLHDIARIYELPPETARVVFDMNKAAEQQAKAIRRDGSLDERAREGALLALRKQTEGDASRLLGEKAFQQYAFQFAAWFNLKISMGEGVK
jgi:RNA polymerase sigma factor (sigma-70 family)